MTFKFSFGEKMAKTGHQKTCVYRWAYITVGQEVALSYYYVYIIYYKK